MAGRSRKSGRDKTQAGLIPPIQLWCVSYSVRRPSGQARYFLSPPTAITAR